MSLDAQIRELERKLNAISKVETQRAYASALNKTAQVIRRDVARKVATDKRIRQRDVINRIFYRRARANNPVGSIAFYAKPLSAIKVPFSKNKRGFRVAGKQQERSFFARMPNQKQHHIYQRKGAARLPIQRINVSIADEVNKYALDAVEKGMRNDFPKKLKQDFNARINGYVTRNG